MRLDLPAPRWAVPEILPEGLTILAGKPKMGKSWLALQAALSVAGGGVAFGKIRVDPGRVLYLSLEDTRRRMQSRLRLLLGDGACPRGLAIATSWPRVEDCGLASLSEWLRLHPDTRLVVIDTFGKFRAEPSANGNAYTEDYSAMSAIKSVADTQGTSILVVHHLRKMQTEDPLDSVSGSLGLTGAADGTLVLTRTRGSSEASLYLTGRDVEEAQLALKWDVHTAWTFMGDAALYARTREQEEVLAILRLYDGGPLGFGELVKQVREATGAEVDAVKMRISRMAQRGQLAREAGLYWIPGTEGGNSDAVTGNSLEGVGLQDLI